MEFNQNSKMRQQQTIYELNQKQTKRSRQQGKKNRETKRRQSTKLIDSIDEHERSNENKLQKKQRKKVFCWCELAIAWCRWTRFNPDHVTILFLGNLLIATVITHNNNFCAHSFRLHIDVPNRKVARMTWKTLKSDNLATCESWKSKSAQDFCVMSI